MPDASKQHKRYSVLNDNEAFWQDGPWCWNCELADVNTLDDAPRDLSPYFCCPVCEREWWSEQPLLNFLSKRERQKP